MTEVIRTTSGTPAEIANTYDGKVIDAPLEVCDECPFTVGALEHMVFPSVQYYDRITSAGNVETIVWNETGAEDGRFYTSWEVLQNNEAELLPGKVFLCHMTVTGHFTDDCRFVGKPKLGLAGAQVCRGYLDMVQARTMRGEGSEAQTIVER